MDFITENKSRQIKELGEHRMVIHHPDVSVSLALTFFQLLNDLLKHTVPKRIVEIEHIIVVVVPKFRGVGLNALGRNGELCHISAGNLQQMTVQVQTRYLAIAALCRAFHAHPLAAAHFQKAHFSGWTGTARSIRFISPSSVML